MDLRGKAEWPSSSNPHRDWLKATAELWVDSKYQSGEALFICREIQRELIQNPEEHSAASLGNAIADIRNLMAAIKKSQIGRLPTNEEKLGCLQAVLRESSLARMQ